MFNCPPTIENIEKSLDTLIAGEELRRLYREHACIVVEKGHSSVTITEGDGSSTTPGSDDGCRETGVAAGSEERIGSEERSTTLMSDAPSSASPSPTEMAQEEPSLGVVVQPGRQGGRAVEVVDLTGTDDDESPSAPPAKSTQTPELRPQAEWSMNEMRALWLAQVGPPSP